MRLEPAIALPLGRDRNWPPLRRDSANPKRGLGCHPQQVAQMQGDRAHCAILTLLANRQRCPLESWRWEPAANWRLAAVQDGQLAAQELGDERQARQAEAQGQPDEQQARQAEAQGQLDGQQGRRRLGAQW